MADGPELAHSPELGHWLAANREPLIRRWLELVVKSSTLDELAARPLCERLRELDLLLDAARAEASQSSPGAAAGEQALERELGARIRAGRPFALAVFGLPPGEEARAWADAIREVAGLDQPVFETAGGATAVLIETSADARLAADRLRAGAWQLLGGGRRLPDLALALHPDDGTEPAALLARTQGAAPAPPSVETEAPAPPSLEPEAPAPRPSLDLWEELAELRRARGRDEGGRPPAPVTPLYPR